MPKRDVLWRLAIGAIVAFSRASVQPIDLQGQCRGASEPTFDDLCASALQYLALIHANPRGTCPSMKIQRESATGQDSVTLELLPTKAICVGRNYKAHAEALGHALPTTCANDVTVRDLQKDGPWLRAKGMDTFLPIGPRIVTDLDPSDLQVQVRVNGEIRQDSRTNEFIFSIPKILAYITRDICLEPHDLVLTGTPAGVGNLAPGDRVEVEIEGIGVLGNPVEAR